MKKGLILFVFLVLAVGMTSCCRPCRKAKPIEVKGMKWELLELQNKVIERKSNRGSENFFLILGEDGQISGRGDCNGFFGAYSLEGDKISISNIASTRMLCPAQALEDTYFRTLESAEQASIDGDFLILSDKEGKVIASFKKSEEE